LTGNIDIETKIEIECERVENHEIVKSNEGTLLVSTGGSR
jgi:hypothetical protein